MSEQFCVYIPAMSAMLSRTDLSALEMADLTDFVDLLD